MKDTVLSYPKNRFKNPKTRELSLNEAVALPDTVVELLTGRVSGATEQSVLVNLQMYVSFAYHRDRRAHDYDKAIAACRTLCRSEMALANTPTALRLWIRRMHKLEEHSEITEAELAHEFGEIKRETNADEAVALRIRTLLFKSQVESMFEINHGRPINEFDDDVWKACGASV